MRCFSFATVDWDFGYLQPKLYTKNICELSDYGATSILGLPLLLFSFWMAESPLTQPLNPKYLREFRIGKESIRLQRRTWLLSFSKFSGQPASHLLHWFYLREPEVCRAKYRLWCWEWNVWGAPSYASGPHLPPAFFTELSHPTPFLWGRPSFTALPHPLSPLSNAFFSTRHLPQWKTTRLFPFADQTSVPHI